MTLIMGVLNITPDSFSDGGEFFDPQSAVARGLELVSQGADIVDIGGESTRPGATRISVEAEQQRILETVRQLVANGVTVSVDTLNAATARAAIEAGASIINDVSGGVEDSEMYRAIAEARTGQGQSARYIMGHWRGVPDTEHARSDYNDVAESVRTAFNQQIATAHAAGVTDAQIVIDPGLGFDKNSAQGWQLLARLNEFSTLGFPVMIGVSRKRMLGQLLDELDLPSDPKSRDLPTAVTSALAAAAGVWAVRVHDVPSTRVALAVQQSWAEGSK